MKKILLSQRQAVRQIGALFSASSTLSLSVREDKCFAADAWLNIGDLTLSQALEPSEGETEAELIEKAVEIGQYAWKIRSEAEIEGDIEAAMGGLTDAQLPVAAAAVGDGLRDTCRRLCLLLPCLDPALFPSLPFRTPTTVVADTSAVIQGGLDFIARFLHPQARVKIPAVVPTEILNMGDRFLTTRRKYKESLKAVCLREHITSQGSQRALIRLEWHMDVQKERLSEGSDPLRSIFRPDAELTELQLTTVQRSLADRLVFESARVQQAQLGVHRRVLLMTSDQGMARMSLAEGLEPFYFEAKRRPEALGSVVCSPGYHPFEAALYSVPLPSLLWELAVTFGGCKLAGRDGQFFCVFAIGEDLAWFPLHSREDLLWCDWQQSEGPQGAAAETPSPAPRSRRSVKPPSLDPPSPKRSAPRRVPATSPPKEPSQGMSQISADKLVKLTIMLVDAGGLSAASTAGLLGITVKSVNEYRKFLSSAGLVEVDGDGMVANRGTALLLESFGPRNIALRQNILLSVPSFANFIGRISNEGPSLSLERGGAFKGSTSGYRSLADVARLAYVISPDGPYATHNRPDAAGFVEEAIRTYEDLARQDQWILTGQWLEELVRRGRIHPNESRDLLRDAQAAGLLDCFFEGSTPERGYQYHVCDDIEITGNLPHVRRYQIYEGDFLHAERASVRMRLRAKR